MDTRCWYQQINVRRLGCNVIATNSTHSCRCHAFLASYWMDCKSQHCQILCEHNCSQSMGWRGQCVTRAVRLIIEIVGKHVRWVTLRSCLFLVSPFDAISCIWWPRPAWYISRPIKSQRSWFWKLKRPAAGIGLAYHSVDDSHDQVQKNVYFHIFYY